MIESNFNVKKGEHIMMKSPAMRIVGNIVWVVTALYSLNALTTMHGFDLLGWGPLAGMKMLLAYLIGICGLVSLILWGLSLTCHCEGSCNCM